LDIDGHATTTLRDATGFKENLLTVKVRGPEDHLPATAAKADELFSFKVIPTFASTFTFGALYPGIDGLFSHVLDDVREGIADLARYEAGVNSLDGYSMEIDDAVWCQTSQLDDLGKALLSQAA